MVASLLEKQLVPFRVQGLLLNLRALLRKFAICKSHI